MYTWYQNGYKIGIILSPCHTNISTWLVFPQIIWGWYGALILMHRLILAYKLDQH
jgi:hypothetical protein